MIDRRHLIGIMGVGLTIAQSGAWAQPPGGRFAIGFLALSDDTSTNPLLGAFKRRLHELGYDEGRNIKFELRFANGQPDRLPALAADLVQLHADVIVAGVLPTIRAVKGATTTIPIVMVHPEDPVAAGVVASLARPGANVTGLSSQASVETQGKLLQLLKEVVPGLSRVAILRAGIQAPAQIGATEATARRLGIDLDVVGINTVNELDLALATIAAKRPGALLVDGNPVTFMRRQRIADFAIEQRLPAAHPLKEYAQAGLLLTYGPHLEHFYRRAADYVDRILRGAKPADLPIEQPTKFELVINMKTARALGLTIPQALRLRADEVIE